METLVCNLAEGELRKFIKKVLSYTPPKKPCKTCGKMKFLALFSKNSALKSGFSNYCRACSKKKWLKYKKEHGIKLPPGFCQEDAKEVPLSPEEKFLDSYADSDVIVKGVLVMQKGKVLDDKWYQEKLARLT